MVKEYCILIVTYNHENVILNLLESISIFGYKNVYICDANSTDNTVNVILKHNCDDISLLRKNKLEGFAKNNNDLISHFDIKAKYFLLLNPDTYFKHDFLKILVSKMKMDNSIGIICPLILYPNGEIQKSWKTFPNFIKVLQKRFGVINIDNELLIDSTKVEWALGACLLISDRLLQKNKLLDERYRLYCEDIDICLYSWFNNLKVIATNDAVVYHSLQERSSKKILSKYNLWNISSIIKFAIKWNFKYINIRRSIKCSKHISN